MALDALPAETLEDDFDRAAWIAQDLQEQLGRSLALPRDEPAGYVNVLPAKAGDAQGQGDGLQRHHRRPP